MKRVSLLFVVSEYGEFSSLLDLATRLAAVAPELHPVFLFKSDYGALERHRHLVEARGFSWVSEASPRESFDLSQADAAPDDYVPTNLGATIADAREASRPVIDTMWLSRRYAIEMALGAGTLLMLPAYLLYRLLKPFGRLSQKFSIQLVRARSKIVRARIGVVVRVFSQFDPKLVVSGQDYPLSTTAIAAMIAEKRGVKTIIVPFSMTPTTKEIAESFAELGINRLSRWRANAIARRFGSKWVNRYRGRYYARLNVTDIIAASLHELSPPQPWTPNSGRGIVLAPSQQSLDYCTSAGIPRDQTILTGAVWNDQLIERAPSRAGRRAALVRDIAIAYNYWRFMRSAEFSGTMDGRQSSIADDRKLMIVSWPPNQWPRKATGFSDYLQFSQALTDMLASIAHSRYANVAVSMHPTLVGTPMAEAIRASGLYMVDADLIDVIDCADIFVATVSSTLLWSLQLGIPSVNFDPYRYQYQEFRRAGMVEAASLHALRSQLMTLITDDEVFREVEQRMLEQRDYWTNPQGGSFERIASEIVGHARRDRR